MKTSSHDSQYPEISIIIPAVNEANFIGETLDAVTKLIGRIEIIVVDGESDDGMTARFMTWLYPNLRKLGLSYGDSAIFVRREAYEQVGGFKAFPIFEDLDLLRELRKLGRMVHVPAMVVTSSRRFQDRGFAFTFVKWMIMQALYWLGFEPRTLGRFYAPVRDIQ